mmetsp:Transcript_12669/g.14021  ORF Transcript_12669/g.14021 Transcript_12669/m.14021 type:complete len:656 (+) Transcript_12669:149-2116(+)
MNETQALLKSRRSSSSSSSIKDNNSGSSSSSSSSVVVVGSDKLWSPRTTITDTSNLIAPTPISTSRTSTSTSTSSIHGTNNLAQARQLLYVSHFFNQFSEQTWQFCLALFLAAFTNNQSLILVTSYQLVSYLAVCCFGSSVGKYIDGSTKSRLLVARQFIGLENVCVVSATILCYILLSRDHDRIIAGASVNDNDNATTVQLAAAAEEEEEHLYDLKYVSLLIGIHVLGAIAMVLDTGFLVAVERDWVVVMSVGACNVQKSMSMARGGGGNSSMNSSIGSIADSCDALLSLTQKEEQHVKEAWLTDTNVKMRQIDLTCKIIAPAMGGFFIAFYVSAGVDETNNHGYELRSATLVIGAINVLALIVEYLCTAQIYHGIPELAATAHQQQQEHEQVTMMNDKGRDKEKESEDEAYESASSPKDGENNINNKSRSSSSILDDLQVYFGQTTVGWAGLSLALLYGNVALSFNNIMTVYLVWRGIGMEEIGFWRGVASAAGLGGTLVYHYMSKKQKMHLVDIGLISIMFEVICLSSSFVALFVPKNEDGNDLLFLILLVGGVCFSRIGLWVFDISVTMLQQLHVPPPIRGLVGGVQQSLNAFFTVLSLCVGLFFSDPTQFNIFASVSFAGVVFAGLFYAIMVFGKRDQLISSSKGVIGRT